MRFDGAHLLSRGFASDVHTVKVENNNVDRAFKRLKRKMIDTGLFRELKARVFHQKPSQLRVRPRRRGIRACALELAMNQQSCWEVCLNHFFLCAVVRLWRRRSTRRGFRRSVSILSSSGL